MRHNENHHIQMVDNNGPISVAGHFQLHGARDWLHHHVGLPEAVAILSYLR